MAPPPSPRRASESVTTRHEQWGLLTGHQRRPPPGHQWGLFHGHGQRVVVHMASGSPNASRRRRQACGEEVRGRRVGCNPSIRSLMTTRGWPTPRSCNETGTDSSGLPGTSCRLLPGQGHHHDRTSAHQPSPGRAADLRRVRDGLGTAQERTRPRGAAGKVGPSQPHPHRGMGPSPSLRQHPTEPPRHTLARGAQQGSSTQR